jgi:hypothetical protein
VSEREDEMAGLRNIYTALQPGGRAIILVPHGQEIFGSLDTALAISAATPAQNSNRRWSRWVSA